MQTLEHRPQDIDRLAADDETLAWLADVYEDVDAQDADAFADRFAPDATLRFANADPARGPEEVRRVIGAFFEDLAGLEHRPRSVLERDGAVVFEAHVTYTLPDGDEVTVPATTVIERPGEAIEAMRIYVDLAPLRR